MSELNRPIGDEVLSAYLDHELSSDERARVDRWLQEHEEARRQLQELSQLRDRLRELPRPPVDADFTARVLARIAQEPPPVQRVAPRRDGWRRGLIWAGLVVATSIALLLIQPPTAEEQRELADLPAARTDLERAEDQRATDQPAAPQPTSRGVAEGTVSGEPEQVKRWPEIGAAEDVSAQADQLSLPEEQAEQAAPPAGVVADTAAGAPPVPAPFKARAVAPPVPSAGRSRGALDSALPSQVPESLADAPTEPAPPANEVETGESERDIVDRAENRLQERSQFEANRDAVPQLPPLGGLILVTGSAQQIGEVVAQLRAGKLSVEVAQPGAAAADSLDLYFNVPKSAVRFSEPEAEVAPQAGDAERLPALQGPGISSLLVTGTPEQVTTAVAQAAGVSYQWVTDPQQWLATQATTDRRRASAGGAADSAPAEGRATNDATESLTQALADWQYRLLAAPAEPPNAAAAPRNDTTVNQQPQQPRAAGDRPSDGAGSRVDLSRIVLVILQETAPVEP